MESKSKIKLGIQMTSECQTVSSEIEIFLAGTSAEDLSETLLTIFHEAWCPLSIHVTVAEYVVDFETESSALLLYKNKSNLRGRFGLSFLNQIDIHQVKNVCTMSEIMALGPRKRPYTLLATDNCRFLRHWDREILHDFQDIRGFMYLGASQFNDKFVPNFTQLTDSGIKGAPLHRSGPSLPCVWASLPMLVRTSDLPKGPICNGADLGLALMETNRSTWTSRHPVAVVVHNETATIGLPKASKAMDLGIFDNASQMEIIMKFGSIGALQWLLV